MEKGIKKVFTVLLVLMITFTLSAARVSEKTLEMLDKTMDEYVKSLHIPGLSFSIVSADEVLLDKQYGNCNSNTQTFFIGSLSKSFTAACVMQLYEKGKIDLEAEISRYIDPKLYFSKPNDASRITVRQLLNHTSGLDTHQRLGNAHVTGMYGKYEYANVNYNILGKIIENVSGISYKEYVHQNIFEPLGLVNTGASEKESINEKLLPGFRDWFGITAESPVHYPDDSAWFITPAGYLSSCTKDMGRYLQMYLRNGEGIISARSIQTMHKDSCVPCSDKKDNLKTYGFAWFRSSDKDNSEMVTVGHIGENDNFTCRMFILPEKGLAAVILTNKNDRFLYQIFYPQIEENITSVLRTGKLVSKIPENAYFWCHLIQDFIYGIILFLAFVPGAIYKRINRKRQTGVLSIVLLFFIIPVLFVVLLQLLAVTPLWVVRDYVPDLYIVLLLFIAISFAEGVVIMYAKKKSERL